MTLVAASPVNVHMWLHPELLPHFPRWVFALLLWLNWWSCRQQSETEAA